MIKSAKLVGLIVGTLCMLSGGAMADVDEITNEAIEFVTGLSDDCIYLDGYQCQEAGPKPGESSRVFEHLVDSSGTLPAIVLPAWNVAYQRFLDDPELTEEQKKLKHYRVGFALDDEEVLLVFRPLFLPQMEDGKPVGIMRATMGKELQIRVDLRSLEVAGVLYGK